MKLNVWYIQETVTPQGQRGFQPVRFTKRNGRPELGAIHPTVRAARIACGSPDAELL
jgi:hypothetical protein